MRSAALLLCAALPVAACPLAAPGLQRGAVQAAWQVEARTPQKISVMPEKLAERMTLQELRDLIAFLDSQR